MKETDAMGKDAAREGDGELFMHTGALTVARARRPRVGPAWGPRGARRLRLFTRDEFVALRTH